MSKKTSAAAHPFSHKNEQAPANRPTFHGSDVELVEKFYQIPREEIICFSDNINPLGLSPKLKEAIVKKVDAICHYPERDYAHLRSAAAAYVGAKPKHILAGCGATDLISRFIREIAPKRAVLISPSYSEYEREVALVNGELILFPLLEENSFKPNIPALKDLLNKSTDLLIFCNPNNPTGFALHHDALRELFTHCKSNGIFCLVDETYAEFSPYLDEVTAIPLIEEFDNIFVLRGISKFFAAPGLRFGYAATSNETIISRINHAKEPWSVNSIADACVPAMFKDTAYIRKTKDFISAERSRLTEMLAASGTLFPYPTETNFILVKIKNASLTSADVFDALILDRFMIRDCSSFEGLGNTHIRFNIRKKEENNRMIRRLLSLF